MNRYFLLLIAAFMLSFYDGEKLDFINNNIPAAQDLASREGKLVVVQFGAQWCQPCIFMDENTWANTEVVAYMKDHCVAAKVDVDDYKGQVFRDQYAVRYYPSVLIFNSKGDLLHKHEGLLGAESMIGLLQTYASQENESRVNASPATAENDCPRIESPYIEPETEAKEQAHELPPPYAETDAQPVEPSTEDPGYESKKGKVNQSPGKLKAQRTPASPVEPAVSAPRKSEKPAIAAVPKRKSPAVSPKVAAPSSPKLRKSNPSSGFTVQVGVYAAKISAQKEAEKVAKKFGKKGSTVESVLKGKKLYRGVVGEFSSKADAAIFRQKIQKSGVQAIVKAWSELK